MHFLRFVIAVFALTVIPILVGVGVVIFSNTLKPSTGLAVFDNRDFGISFSYPSEWKKEYPSKTMIRFSQDPVAMIFEGKELDAQKIRTLAKYTKENLSEIAESAEASGFTYVLEESAPAMLGGKEAHRISVLMEKEWHTLRVVQVWSIVNDRIYAVSFSAPLNGWPTAVQSFENVLQSLKIRD
ncbi:hypothetical protein HY623_00045 [Candidatus Uhrbacteria bacterium]|nr:hypothetical protein [Candidatus Uhrbacteria bacterium]